LRESMIRACLKFQRLAARLHLSTEQALAWVRAECLTLQRNR
jgi:hypothetical protein